MARAGLGLALDLQIAGGTVNRASGVSQQALERAVSRGAATVTARTTPAVRQGAGVTNLSPYLTGEAFLPEVMELIYGHDSAWAAGATLVDGRQVAKCGGGGCNAPSCAHQYWSVGLPCNEQNLQAYLFQLPRFIWAQNRLGQLLSNPPTRWDSIDNINIATKSRAWETWITETYKAMALLRWASNVRWELVTSKIPLPFEPAFGGPLSRAAPHIWSPLQSNPLEVAPSVGEPVLAQFLNEAGRLPGRPWVGALSWFMETPLTWAFAQAGRGYFPDCRPWIANTGDVGDVNALNWDLRVPSSAADFAPMMGAWRWPTPTQPAERDDSGRLYGFEYQCVRFPDNMNIRPARSPRSSPYFLFEYGSALAPGALTQVYRRSSRADEDYFDRVKEWRGTQAGVTFPMDEVGPSPLMQILIAKRRAEAYANLAFGDVVSAGLSAWSEMLLAQPEGLRGADARTLEALQQNIMQAQLNEAAAYVGAGFGAAATLATTMIPQPYGAIVGAVIAVIGAIVTALMGAAYDIGLARADRPPCPAPPVLRMIEDPNTGACDFDAARRGAEEVLGKSNAIVSLIGSGVLTPGAWFPVLEELSRRPMDTLPPDLPPPDAVSSVSPAKWVAGGLLVGGAALGLFHLLGRR